MMTATDTCIVHGGAKYQRFPAACLSFHAAWLLRMSAECHGKN